MIAAGAEPEDTGWWSTDDLWRHALDAVVVFVRAAAERQDTPVEGVCNSLAITCPSLLPCVRRTYRASCSACRSLRCDPMSVRSRPIGRTGRKVLAQWAAIYCLPTNECCSTRTSLTAAQEARPGSATSERSQTSAYPSAASTPSTARCDDASRSSATARPTSSWSTRLSPSPPRFATPRPHESARSAARLGGQPARDRAFGTVKGLKCIRAVTESRP
jgi:hypothetical protein